MAENSSHPDAATEERLEVLFEDVLRGASLRNGGSAPTLRDWLELAESWRILHALRECRGNRSAAARSLGIGRRTLYSKMEKLGIEAMFSRFGARDSRGRAA